MDLRKVAEITKNHNISILIFLWSIYDLPNYKSKLHLSTATYSFYTINFSLDLNGKKPTKSLELGNSTYFYSLLRLPITY